MIACYDLARCPPTFDVVAFLAHAELERVRRHEEHLDIHILPGPWHGFRHDSLWPRTVEERVHMLVNVLVPLCKLLPSVRSVGVGVDRSIDGWGKGEYLIGLPAIVRALGQGCRPLTKVSATCSTHFITFTLRESEHHPLRNSRTEEWCLAAEELARRGCPVFILRDARKASVLLDLPLDLTRSNTIVQEEDAPGLLIKRAGLYAAADLNIGISNGPMWMSIFMDAPTLMLRPTTNAAGGCYDDAFYKKWGVPRGSQLPGSPAHQRLAWCEDTCDNIVREVEEMLVDAR